MSNKPIYDYITKNYRTLNKWADTAILIGDYASRGDYHSPQDIMGVIDNPRYRGLKWRYYQVTENKEFHEMPKSLPIAEVLNFAHTLMRPVYTDFTEVSEHEEFIKFSGQFYYQLFIQEFIFVSYNIFETTDFIIKGQSEKIQKTIEAIKAKGGFDVWVKLDEDEYSENIEFMHVDTSLVVKLPKWREQMAWCRWGAVYQGNVSNWINLAGMELLLKQYLDHCIRLCGKKIMFTTDGHSQEQLDKLNDMLKSFNNYIHVNMHNIAGIKPLEAFEGSDLEAIRDTIDHYLDRLKFEYGRVSNTNPKGERLTSGENYKDISSIANRQKETLEYLISFAYQVQKLWNIHLEFAVSGIPEKEAIYTMGHMAETPNMEKETFGQIEGTRPRPPIGKAKSRKVNKSQQWRN